MKILHMIVEQMFELISCPFFIVTDSFSSINYSVYRFNNRYTAVLLFKYLNKMCKTVQYAKLKSILNHCQIIIVKPNC